MLKNCDAGLIIGDLKLFELASEVEIYDLGRGWHDLTGLPFVYAGWLAREESISQEMVEILTKAKTWGLERLEELARIWSEKWNLSFEMSHDYLFNVMNYNLSPEQFLGLTLYQQKCFEHNLLPELIPIRGF